MNATFIVEKPDESGIHQAKMIMASDAR
jgi:hypothetical protein